MRQESRCKGTCRYQASAARPQPHLCCRRRCVSAISRSKNCVGRGAAGRGFTGAAVGSGTRLDHTGG